MRFARAALRAADMPARDAAPTAAPAPSAAEAAFLAKIMRDLPARYPTRSRAIAAGYVRFTNEDDTGAISYVNVKAWNTIDPDVPAQLWYDVEGASDRRRLQRAARSPTRPPPGPRRSSASIPYAFTLGGAHIHYVHLRQGIGQMHVRQGVGRRRSTLSVGDVEHPTADGLVKPASSTTPPSVSTVFLFPAIYDVVGLGRAQPARPVRRPESERRPERNAGQGEDM